MNHKPDPHKDQTGQKEEQYRLLERARTGDSREKAEAREQLILMNLGLVKRIVCRFAGKGFEWDDLMQVGSLGLLKAIDRFDPSYDVMFSTYAVPMVLGELKRYIRDDGRIKISRDMKSAILKMRKEREEMTKQTGRPPRLSQLAERLAITVESLMEILEAEAGYQSVESLDDPVICEKIRQQGDEPEAAAGDEMQIDRILLHSIIENLPPRERQIIILRYFKDMTQTQVAELLHISQVHVSRLEKKILTKIGASFGPDRQQAYPGSL